MILFNNVLFSQESEARKPKILPHKKYLLDSSEAPPAAIPSSSISLSFQSPSQSSTSRSPEIPKKVGEI
jgi:hypothetical protein